MKRVGMTGNSWGRWGEHFRKIPKKMENTFGFKFSADSAQKEKGKRVRRFSSPIPVI